jgi:hypothetical protein
VLPYGVRFGMKKAAEGRIKMAYSFTNSKDKTYYLHCRETVLKNGNTRSLYFFAKEPKEGAIDAVPEGYEVSESKNGLPVLKKSG